MTLHVSHLIQLHVQLAPHRLELLLGFVFVLGLLAGVMAGIRLVAPVAARAKLNEALASYVAYRQADGIHADSLARMASVVQATRQPVDARPSGRSAFSNSPIDSGSGRPGTRGGR
jgi:hypothetical protein